MFFNPLDASEKIKQSYIDYLTTTFEFADDTFKKQFEQRLKDKNAIAKGPYLEVNKSYKTGETLQELIDQGRISPLFSTLESCEERDKEFKLQRPLYTHQVEAFEKANKGENIIVTTGTGYGKT